MKKLIIKIALIFCVIPIISCGNSNVLSSFSSKKSLEEQAAVDMQNGKYTEAQTKLETLLSANSSNYTARSMLAACYAAQGGIILFEILVNAATNTSLSNPGSNPINFAATLLPTPSATTMNQILLATNMMALIPTASMTSDMQFQQAMFLDIYLLLQINDLLNTLRAGGTLTAAQVSLLFSTIGAVNSANAGSSNGLTSAISSVTSGISNSPGGTQAQQVANYLIPFI